MASLKYFGKFITSKGFSLIFYLFNLFCIVNIFCSGNRNYFFKLLWKICRINIEVFGFFFICSNKKLGMSPCSIVKSLIVIFNMNFHIFCFAFYHDKCRFFCIFICFVFPNYNVCTSLPLTTM